MQELLRSTDGCLYIIQKHIHTGQNKARVLITDQIHSSADVHTRLRPQMILKHKA